MTAHSESLTGRRSFGLPPKRGLYDPAFEKDSCGIGFVCDIKGRASRGVVEDALGMNCSMEHRGGIGYEKNTGDGAGILLGLPDRFLRRAAAEQLGIELPERGRYGVGNVFLPTHEEERELCLGLLEREIESAGQRLLGWRELPTDPDGADIGNAARAAMPHMLQLFVGAGDALAEDEFERRLYLIRKHATHLLRGDESLAQRELFYICSLSSKVIVYKGMLTPNQMAPFFGGPDPGGFRVAPGHGAFALQHQHLPVLGPGAAQPLHVPQRRDQHAARQRQRDERPRGRAEFAAVRRRPGQALSRRGTGLFRLRDLRQRAGVPADDRAQACRKRC